MTAILCPTCRHSIDGHEWWGDETLGYKCDNGGLHGLTSRDCPCTPAPSDIARALLSAEPTQAEVERAARVVWRWFVGDSLDGFDKHTYAYDREKCMDAARAALKAARGLS